MHITLVFKINYTFFLFIIILLVYYQEDLKLIIASFKKRIKG